MTGATSRQTGGATGWPLVAAGTALIAVSYGLARYAYGLYLPTLRLEFGLSASVAGALASAAYGCYCLAIAVSAALTARHRARQAAVLAGAAATLATGMIAVAPSPAALAVGIAIGGASTGLASPPLVALVAAAVRPDADEKAQTIVNAGTGLGVLVSGPSALLAAEHWRSVWALFAALSLAVTVAIATTSSATRARPHDLAGLARRRAESPPGGRRALIVGAVGLGVASSAYWTFGRDLLSAVGPTGTTAPATLWIALGAAGVLAAATGHLVARCGIGPIWAALLLSLAIATATLALQPQSLPLALASAVLFGASYVALTGVLILWASRLAPHRAATAVAGSFLLLSLGQLVGASLIGTLIDHAGWTPAFLTAAGTALACIPLAPTRHRHPNPRRSQDGHRTPAPQSCASPRPALGRPTARPAPTAPRCP
jgi:predicted MFS family arabinose efflux permease